MASILGSLSLVATNAQLDAANDACLEHALADAGNRVLQDTFRRHRAQCALVTSKGELCKLLDLDSTEDSQMLEGILQKHRRNGASMRPRPTCLPLGSGVPVTVTANLFPQIGLVNGATGRVICSCCNRLGHKGFVTLELDRTGPSQPKQVFLRPTTQLIPADPRDVGCSKPVGRQFKITQLACRLAFGSTVHSCQGRTLPALLWSTEDNGWSSAAYVALSRCRRHQDVHIRLHDTHGCRTLHAML